MDVPTIIQTITELGFPVAVCLISFWYINKQRKDHKAETDKLAEALNNNTLVMQQLVDKIDGGMSK